MMISFEPDQMIVNIRELSVIDDYLLEELPRVCRNVVNNFLGNIHPIFMSASKSSVFCIVPLQQHSVKALK